MSIASQFIQSRAILKLNIIQLKLSYQLSSLLFLQKKKKNYQVSYFFTVKTHLNFFYKLMLVTIVKLYFSP
jgi:hypothetical protein